jgi:hypothetical protein
MSLKFKVWNSRGMSFGGDDFFFSLSGPIFSSWSYWLTKPNIVRRGCSSSQSRANSIWLITVEIWQMRYQMSNLILNISRQLKRSKGNVSKIRYVIDCPLRIKTLKINNRPQIVHSLVLHYYFKYQLLRLLNTGLRLTEIRCHSMSAPEIDIYNSTKMN